MNLRFTIYDLRTAPASTRRAGIFSNRQSSIANRKLSRRAFTLIEIMVVVAIIGLIAAMGVPSVLQTFRKEGMRKVVSDVTELLGDARAHAILTAQTTEVVFHPVDKRLEGAGKSLQLPAGMDIAMLDINLMDFGGADAARVRFFPNGTCDEMVLVLHSGDDWQKVSLEFSTAIASARPVTR